MWDCPNRERSEIWFKRMSESCLIGDWDSVRFWLSNLERSILYASPSC